MFIELTHPQNGKRFVVNVNHISAVIENHLMMDSRTELEVKEDYDTIKCLISEAIKKGGIIGWQMN